VMRAVAVEKLGETPRLMNLPKPSPGEMEVLVHLKAAGVNPIDWKIADGAFGGRLPHVFPLILGVDGSGTVEEVGPVVKRLGVNDPVFGQFFHPPVGIGTYAEYVVAPETLGISRRVPGMSDEQAAAIPTAGMTALQAIDRLLLVEGDSLLILGAAGGVGTFAVQIASGRGITTLAASGGPHREFLNDLGAAGFYDSSAPSFHEDVLRGYPNGVTALLDLGRRGPEFERNLSLVRRHGTVASTVGAATEDILRPRGLVGLNVNLEPNSESLDRLSMEYSSGRLQIPLEEAIPLDRAPGALEKSRQGKGRGKTVLRI
jgi:NADPH:quinone reductase